MHLEKGRILNNQQLIMKHWLPLFWSCFLHLSLSAQVIELEEFSSGYTAPVDIAHAGDGRLFIVQQNGYIFFCDSAGNKNATPFLDVHLLITYSGERGLLGMAFHPDYSSNGFFFIYYTRSGDGALVISRWAVSATNPDSADAASEAILIVIPHPGNSNHNGGCLQFDPDHYLYIGTGDGGGSGDPDNNGQTRLSLLGKLLRLDVDVDSGYAVPSGNPFVDDPTFAPEIWSLGLRNPWRFSFDQVTGNCWIADVGQNNREEIDLVEAPDTGGQNYGWDCYEAYVASEVSHCDSAGALTWPVYDYNHSGGDCSVTGGFVYRGARFKNFYGHYVFTDYCSGKFRTLNRDGNGNWFATQLHDGTNFTFSTFGEDRYGELYVAALGSGKIFMVTDTACAPVAQILISSGTNDPQIDSGACFPFTLQTPFAEGFSYQWLANGEEIANATSHVFTPFTADSISYTVVVTNAEGCSSVSSPVLDATLLQAPTILGLDSAYCLFESDSLIADFPGGIFSGPGVIENVFYPDLAGVGTHTISYTYTNSYQCELTTSAEVEVEVCAGVAVEPRENRWVIYPNPSAGIFSVHPQKAVNEATRITVRNFTGQEVFSRLYPAMVFSENVVLNLTSLPNGIYSIHFSGGELTARQTVVIHR
jgi:glucose/arabinose dehydrogenase